MDADVRSLARHPRAWVALYLRRRRHDRALRRRLDLAPGRLSPDAPAAREVMWSRVGPQTPVVYLEFGVQHGTSLRQAVRSNHHPSSRFYGFDSFAGLPHDWTPLHREGAMRANPPPVNDPRVSLVRGWFADTVPTFFRGSTDLNATIVVHLDPDLFSSAIIALSAVLLAVDEVHLMVDDCTDEMYDALVLIDTAFGRDFEVQSWSKGTAGFAKTITGSVRLRAPRDVG